VELTSFTFVHEVEAPTSLLTIIAPVIAWLLYFIAPATLSNLFAILLGISLMSSVMAAVHHAEVIAHKVDETFGTLVLAVAVIIIEVS
jgi:Ca2+:H+ antiporter